MNYKPGAEMKGFNCLGCSTVLVLKILNLCSLTKSVRTENTLSLKFIFIGQMIHVTGTSCNLLTSFHNNVWVWLMSWYLPTVQYIHVTKNIRCRTTDIT